MHPLASDSHWNLMDVISSFSESRCELKRLSDRKADTLSCLEMHSFAFLAPCIVPTVFAPCFEKKRKRQRLDHKNHDLIRTGICVQRWRRNLDMNT